MDNLSISDIMWNLSSGFREISFKDAEFILIEREQRLKAEVVEIEDKYNALLKEKDALKNKCNRLQKESKEDTLLRRELRDELRAKESEVKKARTKIRFMETENATACRRANELEKRAGVEVEENARLLLKIKGLEEEKAEAQREIEMHLQKIGFLEKEKEDALSQAQIMNNIFNRFKGRINSLTEDSSLNLTSANQATLNTAYDRGDADEERRSIRKIKEEPEQSNSALKLSGTTSRDPSLMVSNIGSNRKWPHPLKRRRDSSGSLSSRLLDNRNDNRSMLAVASDASWRSEADMLRAIETNPTLAMEAVCVLYRQHKSHANPSSSSAYLKNRGFDSLHVSRGIALAEFLLNGNPNGDMKKSLEELQLHDPKGLHDCKVITKTHSRQLFEIYQRQDDPFFCPK